MLSKMHCPEENCPPIIPSNKLSGPFRATKIWNEIVEVFSANMPRRNYRRQLKCHQNCFTASAAVNFLHKELNRNENTPENVTRNQTIKLLNKFLECHVIEDIYGRWRNVTLEDNNQLYRLYASDDCTTTDDVDATCELNSALRSRALNVTPSSFKLRRKRNNDKKNQQNTSTPRRSVSLYDKRPRDKTPDLEKNTILEDFLRNRLQIVLGSDSADHLFFTEFQDEWLRHNVNEVGRSGVVQVLPEEDVPSWTLQAMVCLATWPEEKESGLPQYPGFQKDVFNAISRYYCEGENFLTQDLLITGFPQTHSSKPDSPLMTTTTCRALAKIGILPPEKLCEVLQLCLLLIPPSKRRKLHLLVRFMAKVINNTHLSSMDECLSTKDLVLQTFSKCIFASDDAIASDLLALTVTSLLMKNHSQIFKVPEELFKTELQFSATDPRGQLRRTNSLDAIKALISGSKSMMSAQKLGEKIWKSRRRRRVASTTDASLRSSFTSTRRRAMTINCSLDLNKSIKGQSKRSQDATSLRPAKCVGDITIESKTK